MRSSIAFLLHIGGLIAMLWVGVCWGDVVRVQVLDASGQPLPEAVVSVAGLGASAAVADATLDQRELRFVPRVLAVGRGGNVRFLNGDRVNHHVYSFSPVQRFDLRVKRGEDGQSIRFDTAGTVVVGCNIHDWMLGFIRVVDSGHFALTDANGEALLDVPKPWPEAATLRAWHPRIAESDGEVSAPLAVHAVLTTSLPLKPDPWLETPDYR